MTTPVEAFPAPAVEAICKELAETVTGSQIPNILVSLKVSEPHDARSMTKWKRLFNAVAERQNHQKDGRPLIRLIAEVMQPVRFSTAERFEQARAAVNGRLLLYGYSVRENGRVHKERRASTLTEAQRRANDLDAALRERGVHTAVLAFCRAELLQENYFHAVLEAVKSLADRIRTMTGTQLDGAQLVEYATSRKNGQPRIAFNDLVTQWDISEHNGLAMLAKGLFSAVRNPTAHAPRVRWAVERPEALDILTLVSMLHRRLDGISRSTS